MGFQLIEGTKIGKEIRTGLKKDIEGLPSSFPRKPCLAVVLVGEDPASRIYVEHKKKACSEVGILSKSFEKPETISEEDLCNLIFDLNADENVDGILVQLPLPSHINSFKILSSIDPAKDVDGLTPTNQGLLAMNKEPYHVPCTPRGIVKLLEKIDFAFQGSLAVVLGRSLLVGAPVSKLLLQKNATLIHMHSKTREPQKLTQQADLLVVAVGSPQLIGPEWVKEGAVVIDVGIHRKDGKLCGDVDFENVKDRCSWITPVPGGVGPMTIACLLLNCFEAYKRRFA